MQVSVFQYPDRFQRSSFSPSIVAVATKRALATRQSLEHIEVVEPSKDGGRIHTGYGLEHHGQMLPRFSVPGIETR